MDENQYKKTVKKAGFEVVSFENTGNNFVYIITPIFDCNHFFCKIVFISSDWKQMTLKRAEDYSKIYSEKCAIHGEQNGPIQYRDFYNDVAEFFNAGGQGAKILLRKI